MRGPLVALWFAKADSFQMCKLGPTNGIVDAASGFEVGPLCMVSPAGARRRNPERSEGPRALWRDRVGVEPTGDIEDAARRF